MQDATLLIPGCNDVCSPCPTADCLLRGFVPCDSDTIHFTWQTLPEPSATYRLTGPGLDAAVDPKGSRTEPYDGPATYKLKTFIGTTLVRECEVAVDRYCGCPIFIEGTVRTTYYTEFDLAVSGANCGDCDNLRCPDLSGVFAVNGAGACEWYGGPFGVGIGCTLPGSSPRAYSPFKVSLKVTSRDPVTGIWGDNVFAVVKQDFNVLDPRFTCVGWTAGWKLLGPSSEAPFDGALLEDVYTQLITPGIMCNGTIAVS